MTTSQNNTNIFFTAMDREVTYHKDTITKGENGATEHSIYGMSGHNSQVQGALTAAYAGLTRGASRQRIQELYRNIEETSISQGKKAHQHAIASSIILGFQKRDCRGGDGEKDVSRWWMIELWNRYPNVVEALAPLFPEYGYWKDMTLYIQDLHNDSLNISLSNQNRKWKNKTHPLAQRLYQIMITQLKEDISIYDAYQTLHKGKSKDDLKKFPKPTISLLAKWIPKEGRSFDKHFGATKVLTRMFYPELYETNKYKALKLFRLNISKLNEVITTTERLMSLNLWDQINWRLVPGKCLQKHRRAFLNLVGGSKCKLQDERSSDPKRRTCRKSLMEYMELATEGKTSLKGKTLHIHEIVNKFGVGNRGMSNLAPEEKLLLELQWKTKKDDLKKMIHEESLDINQFVVMADFSDSMLGTPIQVAMAFGIMLSEIMVGPYANRVLSFSENPAWIVFRDDMNLEQKIQHALKASWGGSTNFLKAHDLILTVALKHRLTQQQMPKGFLCVSDMQFNSACRGISHNSKFDVLNQYADMDNLRSAFTRTTPQQHAGGAGPTTLNHDTIHQVLVKTYADIGRTVCGEPWTMGRSIYWNVQGSTAGFPVQSDTPHTQLVSGFAIEMIKLVFQGKYTIDNKISPTPWLLLVDILAQDRYHPIFKILQDSATDIFHDFKAPILTTDDNLDMVFISTPDTLHAELQSITAHMASLTNKLDPDSTAKKFTIQTRIQEIIKALADPSIYNQ